MDILYFSLISIVCIRVSSKNIIFALRRWIGSCRNTRLNLPVRNNNNKTIRILAPVLPPQSFLLVRILPRVLKILVSETIGLKVIYGDTNSIMIITRICGDTQEKWDEVERLGKRVLKEVNKGYHALELDQCVLLFDGIQRSDSVG